MSRDAMPVAVRDARGIEWGKWRGFFLSGIGFIYFVAFLSFYIQSPGLYGRHGITPASLVIDRGILEEPSAVLWRMRPQSLGVDSYLDFLALSGAAMSLLATCGFASAPIFIILSLQYQALNLIGAPFLPFQWDILLLEVGGLAVLASPILPLMSGDEWECPIAVVAALRWCLFKLMFMSGVVKIQAKCPTWMGLTALHYHYATQCLPTPAAWYTHQLPDFLQKFSVAGTFAIELVIPFLFILPWRGGRRFAFLLNSLLMIFIAITGNYTFFNVLTAILTLAALDKGRDFETRMHRGISDASAVAVLIVSLSVMFRYEFPSFRGSLIGYLNGEANMKLAFTLDQFDQWVRVSLHWAIPAFFLMACAESCRDIVSRWQRKEGTKGIIALVWTVACTFGALCYVLAACVPFTEVAPSLRGALPPVAFSLYSQARSYHLVSGYGLFRVMTGVGKTKAVLPNSGGISISEVARPELELQASEDGVKWMPLEFRYKPGNVSAAPKWVGLPGIGGSFSGMHQPRLDWQMWFAALGNYQHNPWLVNLVSKLLSKDGGDARALMAQDEWPERYRSGTPPAMIRIVKFEYDFSRADSKAATGGQWWTRKMIGEYLPPLTADNPSLLDFARSQGTPRDDLALGVGDATGLLKLVKTVVDAAGHHRESVCRAMFTALAMTLGLGGYLRRKGFQHQGLDTGGRGGGTNLKPKTA